MKTLKILIAFFFSVLSMFGQGTKVLDLETSKIVNRVESTTPERIIEETSDGIIVTYRFKNVLLQKDPLHNNSLFAKISGFWLNHGNSEPATLLRWDTFIVPDKNVKVIILDSVFIDYPMQLTVAKPVEWNDGHKSNTNLTTIKSYYGFFPKNLISAVRNIEYRNQSLFRVCISPFKYDNSNKIVRFFKEIKYKIKFDVSLLKRGREKNDRRTISDNSFLHNIAINGELYNDLDTNSRSFSATQLAPSHYLIISVPKYEAAVNRFAEWKRTLGYTVHVSMQNSWDTTAVKNTISSAYYSYGIENLLMFGGHSDIPGLIRDISGEGKWHPTDLYYCCFNNSYIPSIFRGRLLVNNLTEANNVIDKIINYEKNPVTDISFYNTALHCSYFQDDDQDGYEDLGYVQTSEKIWNRVNSLGKTINRVYYKQGLAKPTHWNDGNYGNGEAIPSDLTDSSFQWKGNATFISNYINQKSFYVFERDHGDVQEWCHPWYTNNDVNTLNNGNYLPVVFSICCKTGKYDETNCFSENILKKQNGGCVSIYGASESSLAGPNDVLALGMFDAIWPSSSLLPNFPEIGTPTYSTTPTPSFHLGQILDQGLYRVDEAYWNYTYPWYSSYTYETYHCFGDPSMQIYTVKPTEFGSASVTRGENNISVITGGETAKITFYNKSTGNINTYEGNSVSYSVDSPEDVVVCISAHNKIPYIDEISGSYIQNQIFTTTTTISDDFIKVGSNVKYDHTIGPVSVNSGTLTLNGNSVEIQGKTTIKLGASLIINN